jgi:hypothetical protein
MTTTGVELAPIPTAVPMDVITYDATRDMFWGVASDFFERTVWLIDKAGTEVPQFTIDSMDLSGCDNGTPDGGDGLCDALITGIAYDANPDSLWIGADSTQRFFHYDTVGNLLGFYDTNEPGQSMAAQCGKSYATGIAVADHGQPTPSGSATAITWDMEQDCPTWFRYQGDDDNTPVKQAFYSTWTNGDFAEDNECDDTTFKTNVLWVRDFLGGNFHAFEVPTCIHGGGVKISDKDRMTGGGGLPVLDPVTGLPTGERAHHGFMVHCNATVQPDRLEVNWGNGNSFHMTGLASSLCPRKTTGGFDTTSGHGTGRYNGQPCGSVDFSFKDNGEPGNADTGDLTVRDCNGIVVLHAGGLLLTGPLLGEGNYQAHQGAS